MAEKTVDLELQAHMAQLQKMESLGRLAGGVAHDFNNMLTIIQSSAELLRRELGLDMHKECLEELTVMGEAITRAAALTHELLIFSRQEILPPDQMPGIDLEKAILTSKELLTRIVSPGVQVKFRLASVGMARVSPARLSQALLNLAANANDAMSGKGTLTISLEAKTVEKDEKQNGWAIAAGNYGVISVTDTGCGMSKEARTHMFEPFFTTKPAGKGTGLGLATTYGLVKGANGYVLCDSVVGVGTTFFIYLPISEMSRIENSIDQVRFLIVEDDRMVSTIMRRWLRKYPNIDVAENSLEAIELLNGLARLDVVIADIGLPGEMNGIELVKVIRKQFPNVKIIFMSGNVDGGLLKLGDDHFLKKPFAPGALLSLVDQLIMEL
jgi:nitrogen-specific signal transduction histidine kinase